jgi:hypothetical protein
MDPKLIVLLVICTAAVSVTGWMMHSPGPAGTTTMPVSTSPAIPAVTVSPDRIGECTRAADCVPAECCHPSRCIPKTQKQTCNLMCTASCEGPLDCGAGSCSCVNGKCSVVPASSSSAIAAEYTAITIKASPRRYSPIMSSTPGIGLEPVATGFSAGNASFAWKATYGRFLSWNSTDFTISELGDTATNHGEKLYWSFIDKPSSTATPVTVTVTVTDTGSGLTLGSATVTFTWDRDYAVTVVESG